MLSVNARKAMLVAAGIILGFLVSFFVLNILNITSNNSDLGVRIGIMAFFVIAGIIAGLIFEKSSRPRYLAAIQKNPELQRRMESAYGKSFRIGWIIGVLYLLWNIWGVYELFRLGMPLSPAAHLQLILEIVFDGIVVLVSLWLFFERGENATSPNSKKFFLFTTIFFFISAAISASALIVLKSTPTMQQALINSVVDGQGQEISLGEIYPSLGQFSVVLPSDFKMVTLGGALIIAPTTSTQDLSSSTGPYYIMVEPEAMAPQDWAAGEGPVFQASVNSSPNFGKNMIIVTSSTLFGYSAPEILGIAGGQTEAYFSFEQSSSSYVLGIVESSNISDPSLSTLNKNLDSIWSSLTFGTAIAGGSPVSQLITATSTIDMPSLGLKMDVPSDLEPITYTGTRNGEEDVSFSSQALEELSATGNLNPSYCANALSSPLGIIMKPQANNQPWTSPWIVKNVNGVRIYLFSIETAQQACSQDPTARDLILRQSAELRAAFQTIQAD